MERRLSVPDHGFSIKCDDLQFNLQYEEETESIIVRAFDLKNTLYIFKCAQMDLAKATNNLFDNVYAFLTALSELLKARSKTKQEQRESGGLLQLEVEKEEKRMLLIFKAEILQKHCVLPLKKADSDLVNREDRRNLTVQMGGLESHEHNIIHVEKWEHLQQGRPLGQRNYANVFVCTYLPSKGSYAAKYFSLKDKQQTEATKLLQSFETELQILTQIRHKNIVNLVGYYKSNTDVVLLMDLFDDNLYKFLQKKFHQKNVDRIPWFSQKEIVKMSLDILYGLVYLHRCKIAHRDLKSENILVKFKDTDIVESLHITDFGISKIFQADSGMMTNAHLGTFKYMAPEVAKESKYDPFKADVWAFGFLLYEMMGSLLPTRTLRDVVQGSVPDFTSDMKHNMKDLVQIVRQCTRTSPGDRPSMKQVLFMVISLSGRVPEETSGVTTGWLQKKRIGESKTIFPRKAWRKRWFLLDHNNAVLSYWSATSTNAKGVLQLSDRDIVEKVDEPEDSKHKYLFRLINDKKMLRMCASREEDRAKWLKSLQEVIQTLKTKKMQENLKTKERSMVKSSSWLSGSHPRSQTAAAPTALSAFRGTAESIPETHPKDSIPDSVSPQIAKKLLNQRQRPQSSWE